MFAKFFKNMYGLYIFKKAVHIKCAKAIRYRI